MPKFTWVTIFLSVFITVVVTEVVLNEYKLKNDSSSYQANTQIEGNTDIENDTQQVTAIEVDNDDEEIGTNKFVKESSIITKEILSQVKIENPETKNIEFNSKMFDQLDLEAQKDYVIETDIFSGQSYIGTAYEIHLKAPIDSDNYYNELKLLAQKLANVAINENNTFGEKSFYINDEAKKNTVQIIFKTNKYVFGFKYPHTSHNTFKTLSKTLTSSNNL